MVLTLHLLFIRCNMKDVELQEILQGHINIMENHQSALEYIAKKLVDIDARLLKLESEQDDHK